MSQWYTVAFLLLAACFWESHQAAPPKCTHLKEFALDNRIRNQLSSLITAELSGLEYDCFLELVAAVILDDPETDYSWLPEHGMYPLIFDTYETDENAGAKAAMELWKTYIHNVGEKTTFACGHNLESDGLHVFICILK
ncbi:hypothetical protein RB195_013417 [Necator americanus]|uniref:SCP domain-containing protein n=1 Tax=Necator americanus TaxID=51031 RepID=A0ABR1DVF9_NECAM